jgi:hypothetical protein
MLEDITGQVREMFNIFACITNGTIESIGIINLPSVGKKVATAMASVSSTEVFPTM